MVAHGVGEGFVTLSILFRFGTDFSTNNFSPPTQRSTMSDINNTWVRGGKALYRQSIWVVLDQEYQVAHR